MVEDIDSLHSGYFSVTVTKITRNQKLKKLENWTMMEKRQLKALKLSNDSSVHFTGRSSSESEFASSCDDDDDGAEHSGNSRSREFSWESAWFFLARPWEMIFYFPFSSRNTRFKKDWKNSSRYALSCGCGWINNLNCSTINRSNCSDGFNYQPFKLFRCVQL